RWPGATREPGPHTLGRDELLRAIPHRRLALLPVRGGGGGPDRDRPLVRGLLRPLGHVPAPPPDYLGQLCHMADHGLYNRNPARLSDGGTQEDRRGSPGERGELS